MGKAGAGRSAGGRADGDCWSVEVFAKLTYSSGDTSGVVMRFIITVFSALLLWGFASFSAGESGLPKWVPAVGLLLVGLIVQVVYARLVNQHFDAVGMPESIRVCLRYDRGVVPFWVAAAGIVARSFMVAGTIMPLLEAALL